MRPEILASTLALAASPALAEPLRLSSPVYTLTFGVEADTPGLVPLDAQHIDFNAVYQPGGFFDPIYRPIGDGPGGTPTTHSLAVNANNRLTVPDDGLPSSLSFIDAAPGSTVWLLPQGLRQPLNYLWLGIGNDAVSAAGEAELVDWNPGDPRLSSSDQAWMEFRLRDVRAPSADAAFSLYQATGGGSTTPWWTTSNGIDADDATWVTEPGHAHYNWAFTETGVWEIDVQAFTVADVDRLVGDATLDGVVDLADFGSLRASFGAFGDWSQGDFNGDGLINLADFGLLRGNFGQTAQLPVLDAWHASVVPEPAAAGIVAASGMLLLRRRRG